MKLFVRNLACCFLFLLSTANSYANHIVGGEIHYLHVADSTYKITVDLYVDCNVVSRPNYNDMANNQPLVLIYNSSTYNGFATLLLDGTDSAGTPMQSPCMSGMPTQCTDLNSTIPGVKRYSYSAIYSLPHPSPEWRFIYNGYNGTGNMISGRAPALANANYFTGSNTLRLEAQVNSTLGNSTPVLGSIMPTYYCINNNYVYDPSAIDPEGDNLTFKIVNPTTSPDVSPSYPSYSDGAAAVGYAYPYTESHPIGASTFVLTPATGVLTFFPNLTQQSILVYSIEERRGSVLVGKSQREMTLLVHNCIDPCVLATPEVTQVADLTMYPNPVSNQLNITQSRMDYSEVVITNAVGSVVLTQKLDAQGVNIDTRSLSTGVYFATLKGIKGVKVMQLVVMR